MQIWDILYKETVATDVMQIEGGELGGEDDRGEGGGDSGYQESSADSEETKEDDPANDTPPTGQNSEAVERGTQVEVG
jgi:hypothetical protein